MLQQHPADAAPSPTTATAAAPPSKSSMTAGGTDPRQPVSALAPLELAMTMDQDSFHAHMTNQQREICGHLYETGFLNGRWSDVTIRYAGQSYHLHRILMVRSPFLERILSKALHPSQDAAATEGEATMVLDLALNEKEDASSLSGEKSGWASYISGDALAICLSHLYAAPIYSYITTANVHRVIACAYRLELWTLCDMCVDFLVKTLSPENLLASVEFVLRVPTTAGTNQYADKIRQGCFQMLAYALPQAKLATVLEETHPTGAALAHALEQLPFAWVKELIEVHLLGGSEFDKYNFAKKVIERRKRAQKMAKKGPCTETVILLFDRDAKGRVSLTEHVQKKPFVKHAASMAHRQQQPKVAHSQPASTTPAASNTSKAVRSNVH